MVALSPLAGAGWQFFDSNGVPLAGGKLYTYAAGTTTPAATYTSSSGAAPHANPIILDSAGRVPGGEVWISNTAAYKFVLETALSVLIGTYDDLSVANAGDIGLTPFGYTTATDVQTAFNDLGGNDGADFVGFIQSEAGAAPRSALAKLRDFIVPQDFGAVGDGVTNDTAAFVALAAAYAAGRSINIPFGTYLINADSFNLTPPSTYNTANLRPPAITMDKAAVIKAATSGTYLVKLGTAASDYSGYLRNGEFNFGVLHDGGKTLTKGVLYVPFFIDCYFNYRAVVTASPRAATFGDVAAPAASAGVKGVRDYEWDFHDYARTVQSITNAANPVVTFAAPHGLWPSSGNRCVCINFTGTLGSWANINNKSLDCTILSSTQIQLKNVDTTAYGSLPGTATAYLNFPSSRVPKQIAGVTNANPCVITTTTPHLLTTSDIVDVAVIFGMPTLIGQYTATVLSATTFSIPVDTTSTATWGTWGSFGPGWVMQWVAPASCDIAEYHDNATDVDDSQFYSRHFRIHQYHNPATCGWDGKHHGGHFYNFPESGEMLCAYYLGGDNNMVQVQCDGPFRYVFWATGPRNSSTQCSTNVGIMARDAYGCLVRTESGAAWNSSADRLKAASASFRMFSEHVGLGGFSCRDTITANVAAPQYEYGSRNQAASVRFIGSSGAITASFQTASITRSGAGIYLVDFTRPVPLECTMLVGAGTANGVVSEDETYGSRSVYTRQIKTYVAGVLTDLGHINLEWRYP